MFVNIPFIWWETKISRSIRSTKANVLSALAFFFAALARQKPSRRWPSEWDSIKKHGTRSQYNINTDPHRR
jgi:hypothetical protein